MKVRGDETASNFILEVDGVRTTLFVSSGRKSVASWVKSRTWVVQNVVFVIRDEMAVTAMIQEDISIRESRPVVITDFIAFKEWTIVGLFVTVIGLIAAVVIIVVA